MAQAIRNLTLGSKVIDSRGNKFIVIAKDHYAANEVTLLSETSPIKKAMHSIDYANIDYSISDLHYYLKHEYLKMLEVNLVNAVKVTKVPYSDCITTSQFTDKYVDTKAFILSCKEIGIPISGVHKFANEKNIDYVKQNYKNLFINSTWTRTEHVNNGISYFFYVKNREFSTISSATKYDVRPAINVNSNLLVSDEVSNGYYSFIFNEPPVINTIQNMQGNYGSGTKITYTVADKDDSELNHFISFDNGGSWTKITPSRTNNTFVYSHVFNELGEYNTRIKVVDSANNEVTSNLFIISINATNPTVNIVSVIDKVVTFKASCQTHAISKVEVFVNGIIKKTYTSGFDFNLVYEVDRTTLNAGKNSIQIKATSSSNLTGTKDIEVSKTVYAQPHVGTKVEIGSNEYTITNITLKGSNHVYTLDKNLTSDVRVGDKIKVNQDTVKVYCSLSNLENSKNFKEMKLVKAKKLKGVFEGYVEEKFEFVGEGRYSTIKLETERFNSNVESEIIELQQYFDYLED